MHIHSVKNPLVTACSLHSVTISSVILLLFTQISVECEQRYEYSPSQRFLSINCFTQGLSGLCRL